MHIFHGQPLFETKTQVFRACSAPRNHPRILCNLETHLFFNFLKTMTVWHPFWRLVLGNIFGNSWLLLGMASSCSYFCFLILATFSHTCSHSLILCHTWCQLSHPGFRSFITT